MRKYQRWKLSEICLELMNENEHKYLSCRIKISQTLTEKPSHLID